VAAPATVRRVQQGRSGASRILKRGATRRCGRCGATDIFVDRYHLHERCPRCGYLFVREAGAFTGVMLLNFVVTLTLMFIVLSSYVAWRGITGQTPSMWPFALVSIALSIVTPVVYYPYAWSTWVAIDLATRPLDVDEELDALDHAITPTDPEPGGAGDGDGSPR
jgi:uncharacterized protein (DUF983 family)